MWYRPSFENCPPDYVQNGEMYCEAPSYSMDLPKYVAPTCENGEKATFVTSRDLKLQRPEYVRVGWAKYQC